MGRISEFVEYMLWALRAGDADQRYTAARFFAYCPDPRALAALNEALGDEDEFVRFWAVVALDKLRDPSSVQPLCRRLDDDPDDDVRDMAARALGSIRDPRAVPSLVSALRQAKVIDQVFGTVAGTASHALVEIGTAAVSPVMRALSDQSFWGSEPGSRYFAIDTLGRLGDPRACGILTKLLNRGPGNPDVRYALVEALERLAERIAEPVLAERVSRALDRAYGVKRARRTTSRWTDKPTQEAPAEASRERARPSDERRRRRRTTPRTSEELERVLDSMPPGTLTFCLPDGTRIPLGPVRGRPGQSRPEDP